MRKLELMQEELKEKDWLWEKEQLANVKWIKELEWLNGDLEIDTKKKDEKISDLSSQQNKLLEENIKANSRVKELEGILNNLKIE